MSFPFKPYIENLTDFQVLMRRTAFTGNIRNYDFFLKSPPLLSNDEAGTSCAGCFPDLPHPMIYSSSVRLDILDP